MSHHHIFLFQCTIHGCAGSARRGDNPNSICQSMDGSYFVEGHQHQLFPLHSCIALTATFRHHCKNDVYRTTIKPSFFVAPLATTFAIIPHTHFSWARRLHTYPRPLDRYLHTILKGLFDKVTKYVYF